jgi:hypothetical protein
MTEKQAFLFAFDNNTAHNDRAIRGNRQNDTIAGLP